MSDRSVSYPQVTQFNIVKREAAPFGRGDSQLITSVTNIVCIDPMSRSGGLGGNWNRVWCVTGTRDNHFTTKPERMRLIRSRQPPTIVWTRWMPTHIQWQEKEINYICEVRGQSFYEYGHSPCRLLKGEQDDFLMLVYEFLWTLFIPLFCFLHIYYIRNFSKSQIIIAISRQRVGRVYISQPRLQGGGFYGRICFAIHAPTYLTFLAYQAGR